MTEPADLGEDIPRVQLAGKLWPIPELVWLQLSKCRRELIELNNRIKAAIAASDAPTEAGDPNARALRHLVIAGEVFNELSNEDYERLVMRVLFVGLSAAHPTLTWAEFCAWRIAEGEKLFAWLIVRRQSGVFDLRRAGADDEDAASGEAAGVA